MNDKNLLIYQAISFALYSEQVTLPNGIDTEWSVIRHPGAACILPIDIDHENKDKDKDDNGTVILVRTWRAPINDWMLELPGGGIEPGEAPISAARRELREEAGVEATHIVPLGAYRSVQGFSDFILHYFCATGLTQVGQSLDEHEVSEPVPMPFADLVTGLLAGDFIDSQIPTALFLALLHGALPQAQRAALLEAFGHAS